MLHITWQGGCKVGLKTFGLIWGHFGSKSENFQLGRSYTNYILNNFRGHLTPNEGYLRSLGVKFFGRLTVKIQKFSNLDKLYKKNQALGRLRETGFRGHPR